MKKILLVFMLCISAPLPASTREQGQTEFAIDYFGFPLKLQCQIIPSPIAAENLKQLIAKNTAEITPCLKSLKRLSSDYKISGYAQVLLLARWVQELPAAGQPGPLLSFAEAVLEKKPLAKRDQLALLHSMLAALGFKSALYLTDKDPLLLLYVQEPIEGISSGDHFYLWEPGKSFTDLPQFPRQVKIREKLLNQGQPITFEELPEIPWLMTREGAQVSFKTPEACPPQWSFSLRRLPQYEEFLALWPRANFILAPLSFPMLKPFSLEQIFSPRPEAMTDEQFGTCLLNWLQLNVPYDEAHAEDFADKNKHILQKKLAPEDRTVGRQNRNPVETLLVSRKGICAELSITLAGILQSAGYAPNHIALASYDQGTVNPHLNLAVRPLSDDLPEDAAYLLLNGERFYIMDPSVYIYDQNQTLVTRWGDTPYKGKKNVKVHMLNEKWIDE